MGRERKGYLLEKKGIKYIRLQFTDAARQKRDILRKVNDPKNWRRERNLLLQELEQYGEKPLDAARMTFADLCDYYERTYIRKAEYVGGRKVGGLRSLRATRSILKTLRESFGKRLLKSISYGDLERFKQERLKTSTTRDVARHEREKLANPQAVLRVTRSIAAVNRDLALLRRMLNIAVREGWLIKCPFNAGDALISLADEVQRERVLSRDEEARLLAAIGAAPKREHLKGIVLLALDCGLRRGEILTLTWDDIDLARRTATVRAMNAKTARSRAVAMTARVYDDLLARYCAAPREAGERVFKVGDVKRSFASACRRAGVKNFRLHDCRHTGKF